MVQPVSIFSTVSRFSALKRHSQHVFHYFHQLHFRRRLNLCHLTTTQLSNHYRTLSITTQVVRVSHPSYTTCHWLMGKHNKYLAKAESKQAPAHIHGLAVWTGVWLRTSLTEMSTNIRKQQHIRDVFAMIHSYFTTKSYITSCDMCMLCTATSR